MKSRYWIDKFKMHILAGHNILVSGYHGVGKTNMLKAAFDELGYSTLYFSGSTMDPFVDLVGVPRVVVGEDGTHYLELVKPRAIQDDAVDAIFIDELNRAPMKVRNALMELAQFKSINGHRMNRLKVVVAAINPEDDPAYEYDVQPMDPAQRDRFPTKLEIPYDVCEDFVESQYGPVGLRAMSWWRNLPDVVRRKVSPRGLCYALDMFKSGIPLEDSLGRGVDAESLASILEIEDDSTIVRYAEEGNAEAARTLINDQRKHKVVISIIENSDSLCAFYLPLIKSDEMLSLAAKNNANIYAFMLRNLNARYKKVLCLFLANTKEVKYVKPALKHDLFEMPKKREAAVTNEELTSLEVISARTLQKSTEILYHFVVQCKEHSTLKQNKKVIKQIIDSLTVFDDIKLAPTWYPFVYAELKDEKIKGLFEIGNALFQLKMKRYLKDREKVEKPA